MGSIRLSWHEAQGGELPMVCATCGDDATEWVDRRLSTVRPGLMCIVRTRVTVTLPYCPRHRVASWNGFMRVRARSIDQNGITLGQVAEDFVDAVEDYRDNPEKYRRRRRRATVPRAEDDDAEWVEPADEPPPRRRRSGDGGRILYGVLMTVLVIVVVTSCGFGLLFFNLLRGGTRVPGGAQPPGWRQPGPPFRPGPGFP